MTHIMCLINVFLFPRMEDNVFFSKTLFLSMCSAVLLYFLKCSNIYVFYLRLKIDNMKNVISGTCDTLSFFYGNFKCANTVDGPFALLMYRILL